MTDKMNNILIPNVTKLPSDKKVDVSNRLPKEGQRSEFSDLLNQEVQSSELKGGIQLSSHAAKRLQERKIDFGGDEYVKVQGAINKLRDKGSQDSLIVTDQAAYIVDVKNNKVVTAVDKESMNENVFTKIDSTLFVD
jgi:flagellar operon protein